MAELEGLYSDLGSSAFDSAAVARATHPRLSLAFAQPGLTDSVRSEDDESVRPSERVSVADDGGGGGGGGGGRLPSLALKRGESRREGAKVFPSVGEPLITGVLLKRGKKLGPPAGSKGELPCLRTAPLHPPGGSKGPGRSYAPQSAA